MKTTLLIAMTMVLVLSACSTKISTKRAVDPTTKAFSYGTCEPEDLIYADVESRGTGYIKKTVRWDPLTGRVIEYTIEADPMKGIVDTAEAGASIGASLAGTAAKVMEIRRREQELINGY